MFRFTHEIWKTFEETASERARYLETLYSKQVKNTRSAFYLDIGSGLGYNTLLLGKNASEIVAIDVLFPKNNILKHCEKISLVIADAQFLPFREELFDTISLFSVIEHVTNQELALKEAFRVLKSNKELIIQIPNRFFPLELHSGIPLVFFISSEIRDFILRKMGYEWLSRMNIPSKNKLKEMTSKIAPQAKIIVKRVIYPPSVVLSKLRPIYRLIRKAHILNFIPMGYLLIVKK